MMNKLLLTCLWISLPLLLLSQESQKSLIIDENINSQLSEEEIQSVRTASEEMIHRYDEFGDLIDPDQYRITYASIDSFKSLFSNDARIIIDFISPAIQNDVEEYIKLSRTYYEREGVPFHISDARLISTDYDENCNCYQSKIHLNKTIQHYYSNGSWKYEEKALRLELSLEINRSTYETEIKSIQIAPEPTVIQRSQHTLSVLGGSSFVNGSLPNGIELSLPYSLGFSYQFIQPLTFLGNSISIVAGVQAKYASIQTSVEQGTNLRIDESDNFNSVTEVEFLTSGEEVITSITIEPQLGLDLQFLETPNKQMGIVMLYSPRFSISGKGTFTGALSYEETFNERVTVSDVINCGLRDFQGADAIDAAYNTDLYNTGSSFLLSPYYQFATKNNNGLRIGLDFQYYLKSMYNEGGRFLGNYNVANNPDTSGNPDLDMDNSSLIQTVGQDLSAIYVGLRFGYYFSH